MRAPAGYKQPARFSLVSLPQFQVTLDRDVAIVVRSAMRARAGLRVVA